MAELIDDLAAKFFESHEEGNERSAVADYGHYFLGSIIVSDKDGQKFIIDGQQRLTTLTLLLIFLHHKLADAEQKGQIADLIFSQKFGKRSFNLDIPERAACMEALYKGDEFDAADQPESIANILARFADLDDPFPDDLAGPALPYFVDWLVENVHLVEITAYSDGDAYTIFETMNDRGLSLTPAARGQECVWYRAGRFCAQHRLRVGRRCRRGDRGRAWNGWLTPLPNLPLLCGS